MDDEYGYANARLRAMKSRLLTPRDYASLLDEPNVEAVVAHLTHTAYQPAIEAALMRATGWDCLALGLRRHLATTLARITQFFSGKPQRLWQILIARWQVFNLKTILRGQALTIPADEILDTLIPAGDLREADLRRLTQQTSVRAVVDVLATWHHPYAPALLQAMPRYAEQRDVAELELALDRARYVLAFAELDAQDDDHAKLVRRILEREIDATNILTVIRLSAGGGSTARLTERYGSTAPAPLLLKGGGWATQKLFGLPNLPALDQLVRDLHATEFGDALARAQARYNETHALTAFEDELEKYLAQQNLALFHADPLTIGIAIAYLTALINEVRNLRVIGRGKVAGWSRDEIEGIAAVAKLTIITNPSLAPGFRLAGVEVVVAQDGAQVREALVRLIHEGEAGIIAMDAPYFSTLDPATAQRIQELVKPVVVSLPAGTETQPEQRRSRQIAELIRRAIGIRMTFRENDQ